jgi:acyl-coenzyme A thioesterase PaaI-like protein
MAPAVGTEFRARAKVMRAGRTLTVCSCEVHARQESEEVTVAVMQATMMSIATPE